MDDTLSIELFDPVPTCAQCHRILSSGNEDIDLESSTICGDCKSFFQEHNITLSPQDLQGTPPRIRPPRYSSSESIENLFPEHFSSIINPTRLYPPSSLTTPNGSRRWQRGFSDTESDGVDSVYGESDIISYGVYGANSDGSIDGHSFLDSETDIDPMHAGLNRWSSDDDDEWDEVEAGENTLGSLIARVQLVSEGQNPSVGVRIEDQAASAYLDARSFEELVEHLAEVDGSRRGPPPAAISFVNNLERVVVNEDDNSSTCAICKDSFCVGTLVNRLPCLHVYHPSCIKPWLSSRNSCPLCRYEVPTDDRDYENRKQSGSHGSRVQETDGADEEDEGSVIVNVDNGGSGRGRGRWLFVVAPIVSLVSVVVALWLGQPGAVRSSGGQRVDRNRRWSLF